MSVYVYFASLLAALSTVLIAMPIWRRACLRWNLVDDPGPRKIHAAPVPLAGGLAIATGLVVPLLGAPLLLATSWMDADVSHKLVYGLEKRAWQLAILLIGALGMLGLGLWDDRHELKAQHKFAIQLAIALVVAGCGVRITLFVPSPLFSYLVTVFWILTVTNAFNFVDNMNGLSSGLGLIGAALLAGLAARHGQYLVAAFACLVVGALAGFLPFNFPRSTMFLGDSGSHLIGYLLAVLSILPDFHTANDPRRWAVLSPLFILAVPLIDLAWVVIWRWRTGRPIYIGDNNHLSHQLVRRGLSRSQSVLVLWIAALLLGALAFLLP